MKRKMLSVTLALVLCAGLAITAFASEPTGEVVDKITIAIPGKDGLHVTFTNVIDSVSSAKTDGTGGLLIYYIPTETTFSFNMDTFTYLGHLGDGDSQWGTFKAGETYTVYSVWRGSWQFVGEAYFNAHKDDNANNPTVSPSTAQYLTLFPIDRDFLESGGFRHSESAVSIYDYEISGYTPPSDEIAQTVSPTPSTVFVNETATEFEAYLIGGNNFFKLRDLAYVLNGTDKQFSVGYDNETRAITLTNGEAYEPNGGEMQLGDGTSKSATLNAAINISIDGVPVEITAYLIDGNNFMRLRDVMRLLDVGVGYDNETRNITIDTSLPYTDD